MTLLENQKNLPSVIVGDGFENHHESDERSGNRIIQGTLVKFTNEAEWVTRDDEKISADHELIVTDILRVAQKWKDGKPVETRILGPGENFPDLEALNEAAPKSEWVEGPDGQKRGPHQNQYIAHALDPKTMDQFTLLGVIATAGCVAPCGIMALAPDAGPGTDRNLRTLNVMARILARSGLQSRQVIWRMFKNGIRSRSKSWAILRGR